jgi:hypothetical protein
MPFFTHKTKPSTSVSTYTHSSRATHELDAVDTAVSSTEPRCAHTSPPPEKSLSNGGPPQDADFQPIIIQLSTILEAARKNQEQLNNAIDYLEETLQAVNPILLPRTKIDYVNETKRADHFREYAEALLETEDFGYPVGRNESRCRLGLPEGKSPLRARDGDDLVNKLCSKHKRRDFEELELRNGWRPGMEGEEVYKCI